MGGSSSYGGRDAGVPYRACRSSRHRGRLSLDAFSHDYKRWQNSRSLRHNTGRTLSAFTGCRHNRWTPGPNTWPCGAGESHTPIHIEMTYWEV